LISIVYRKISGREEAHKVRIANIGHGVRLVGCRETIRHGKEYILRAQYCNP